jgi:hypothetical protein
MICDFEGYLYLADALAASAAVSMLAAALALPGTRPKLLLALAPVESFSKGSDSRKLVNHVCRVRLKHDTRHNNNAGACTQTVKKTCQYARK